MLGLGHFVSIIHTCSSSDLKVGQNRGRELGPTEAGHERHPSKNLLVVPTSRNSSSVADHQQQSRARVR